MDLEVAKKKKKIPKEGNFTPVDSNNLDNEEHIEPNNKAAPHLRGLAFLIDCLLVGGYFFYFMRPDLLDNPKLYKIDYFFLANIYFFLIAFPESLFRVGPGKLLLGLRIQNCGDETGAYSRFVLRCFIFRLSSLTLLPLFKLFMKKKLFYDDTLNLYVVKDSV